MNASELLTARFQLLQSIVREAGELTLKYFLQDNFQIERKEDDSPVTVADREAEKLLRTRIGEAFADDAVLGEELGEEAGTSGFRWILDPIDGTKSFIHGVPLYSTLIGLEYDGTSQAGAIFAPATGELIYAARGQGAWYVCGDRSPRPARVSKIDRLADALLLTSEIASFTKSRPRDALPMFTRLQNTARLSRTWGDAYGYMMVAVGRADVMIDPVMNVWDAAPLLPILEEAGGTFTDWKGERTILAGEGIGSNGLVLEEVLAATRQA